MRINKVLIFLVVLGIIIISGLAAIVFKNKILPPKVFTFSSNLTGYEASIKDEQAMYEYLTSNQIVDRENTVTVDIIIVDKIDDPMFVQQTPEGEDIIAASLIELENGRKEIQIAPYKFVLEQDEKGKWLDSKFLDVSELILMRNQRSLEIRELPFLSIFEVIKK